MTYEEWLIERAKLVGAQADIQSVIEAIDGSFAGVSWSPVSGPVFSNNGLTVAATAAHLVPANVFVPVSERNCEFVITRRGQWGFLGVGLIRSTQALSPAPISLATVPPGVWLYRSDGEKAHAGASEVVGAGFGDGAVVSMRLDANGDLYFGVNGQMFASPLFTGITGDVSPCVIFFGPNDSPVVTGRFTGLQYSTGPLWELP